MEHQLSKMIDMAQCLSPYILKEQQIPVPCGKCPPCISRRTLGWAFRMVQEQKVSRTSFMLTLTYNSDYVPITKYGHRSLKKSDVQLFIKRLRQITIRNENQSINYGKITYYAAGEYGGHTRRPHYHLLIFNTHPDNIVSAWKSNGIEMGTIHIAPLNMATIQYSFKYLQKQTQVGAYERDDRQKEFQLFSKGLGKNYLTDAMIQWHKADLEKRMLLPIEDGKVLPMPRYYKNKIYDEHQKIKIARYMQDISIAEYEKLIIEYGDELPKILQERRNAQYQKMKLKSKENTKI